MSGLSGKRVLLIISGGIAAFKAAELIRLLRRAGCGVTCALTENAAQFVTPLTLQALSEAKVYSDLFSLTDENEMGHIELSRAADLLVVAPATANILANRRRVPPFGLAGGESGSRGLNWIERSNGDIDRFGATHTATMHPGDVFVIETPGGGGYGDPGMPQPAKAPA